MFLIAVLTVRMPDAAFFGREGGAVAALAGEGVTLDSVARPPAAPTRGATTGGVVGAAGTATARCGSGRGVDVESATAGTGDVTVTASVAGSSRFPK